MIGKPEELIQWLFNQDREKRFEVKEHREKRSLNANAYAWLLIGRIADVMRISKDECYIQMLKAYGQGQIVSVRSDINVIGYFKYYEECGRSKLNGKEFTHYKLFKGSSEYDTKEMAILIDGIVQEAENLGIQTLPAHELEQMKGAWHP